MLSLWLLPLGYFVLSRGKTKKYSNPVTNRTGLIFNHHRIEIINREVAFNLLDTRILEYCEKNRIYLENVSVIEVFKYVLCKLNLKFSNRLRTQKLNQREKIILGLLLVIIVNRILSLLPQEKQEIFITKFENREEAIIHYLIGLTESDLEDLNLIENKFRMEYSYP